MNMAAPLARTGFKFMLTVRDGPDVGATFQLLPPRVSIGRGSDCHVILNDPRVSRAAAVIEFTMEKITISEISNRQALMVNGSYVNEASLKDGDVIQIGETEMTFFVEAMQLNPQGRPAMGQQQIGGAAPTPGAGSFGPAHGPVAAGVRGGKQGISSRQRFYLIVGAVGLLFTWMILTSKPTVVQQTGPGRNEDLEKENKKSEDAQKELLERRHFKNDDEKTRFYEAQKHYGDGFRDFQKGQYARAMRSFETCRTIDPLHPLCTRYYKLAEKERDAMISELILEGRRYREKNMWSRCSAQFEKVLIMLMNKDDVKYKNAETLKKECDLRLEGRFR